MDEFNVTVLEFVSKVVIKPMSKNVDTFKSSADHENVMDWSDKLMPSIMIQKRLNYDGSTDRIEVIIDNSGYAIPDNCYPAFIKFTNKISVHPMFINTASHEFILEETFKWIVERYRNNQEHNLNFISHLENRLNEEKAQTTIHYPVLNLKIVKPFKIGNVLFHFFTKHDFDNYWEQLKTKHGSKSDFDLVFKDFNGRVMVSYTATAEPKKAEELAYLECCLAMDVFRIFSPAIMIPKKLFKVDLDKRININLSNEYLVETFDEERSFGISLEAHNDPYYFTTDMENLAIYRGLNIFSGFLKNQKTNSLYKLISNAISLYSFTLSISDLHLRIAHLIMLIEGLLLEDDYVKNIKFKTIKRFCNITFQPLSQEAESAKKILESIYLIRHAITHKGIKLPIDDIELRSMQIYIVEFLKRLILINQHFNTKEDLIIDIENRYQH